MNHKKKKAPGKELRSALAANMRMERARLQLSQEQLALVSSLSRVHIGAIERGEVSCSLDVLAQIAAALETEPVSLLLPPARHIPT